MSISEAKLYDFNFYPHRPADSCKNDLSYQITFPKKDQITVFIDRKIVPVNESEYKNRLYRKFNLLFNACIYILLGSGIAMTAFGIADINQNGNCTIVSCFKAPPNGVVLAVEGVFALFLSCMLIELRIERFANYFEK